MSHPLVFNHHSLPFSSPEDVDREIVNFLKICLRAKLIGFSFILADESVDGTWFRLELAHGYFWKDWHDQHVNEPQCRDLIRVFRSIATQQPLFTEKDKENDLELFDVHLLNEQSCSALRAAAWNDSPLLSFPTRSPWTASPVTVIVEQLSETGEIVSSIEELCNLHSLEQFEKEKAGLQEKLSKRICSGKELLEQAQQLYPCLRFCGKAEEQLRNWAYPTNFLEQIKEALSVLNTFAEHWAEGRVAGYSHNTLRQLGLRHEVSGESSTVKEKFRQTREFHLPSGEKMLFEDHIKFSQGIRVYFLVNSDENIVFIGYIGKHLPTKSDPK
ncbi:hypothetical protein [Candidatus Electronema sp. TJ]|uniref:hypothetical protein n=1 Tax=Candidatus Electronema sp. TJ TaxID=3401573 RepID=UPI003AA8F0CA